MGLSKRLARIQSFHAEAGVIWDIGCDHGLLGLSFLDSPSVSEIHLVDPSRPVIEELIKSLTDSYITIPDLIFIHHQKGQDCMLGTERKTIFIAGIGGKEIQEIAEALESQLGEGDLLVVSPHRKVLELRKWLKTSKLRLKHEEVVHEDGQFYPILCLSKLMEFPPVSLYGEVAFWASAEGRAYREKELKFFDCHRDEASQAYLGHLKEIKLPI